MSDQTYELNRKLRYISKNEDANFTTKYVIEIDPNNSSMLPSPKPSQPSSQKIKIDSTYSDPDSKKNQGIQYKQSNKNIDPNRESYNQRKQRRNKRLVNKLELRKDDADILKNFNKFNSKNMRIRNDDDGEYYAAQKYNKNNKKQQYTNKNKNKNRNYMNESDNQLDGLYDHLMLHEPMIKKRISRSIDNTNKKQEPTKAQKKMQQFYEQKRSKKVIYPPYLNLDDIQDSRDAKQNKYFKGMIDFNERVKHYARIFTKQIQGDLIVQGVYKNRCIHGDQVYFQLLPKQNPALKKGEDTMDEKIRCKVVYILPWKKNQNRQIVGKIQFASGNKTYYLVPINKRIISFDVKFSEISQQNLKKVNEKYFIAEFTGWKQTDQYPGCKILREFGQIGQLQTETQALLINNGVVDQQYDEQTVKKGLAKFLNSVDQNGQYRISKQQINSRSDLRNQFIFTIDPLTAKDFDDALSIVQAGVNQNNVKIYEVGVHIADASYFVEQGGDIDQRAQQTTTSVYLVHRVLPMLPRVLCQTMCSLNPGLERLTLSVWFKITAEGDILEGSRYDRSVIKSKARFTYEQAQKIINKQIKNQQQVDAGFGCVKAEDFDRIANDLSIMNDIAIKLRNIRIKKGSLIFQTPKKSFKLDQNFYPIDFSVAKRFEANFLVQQYMLLANQKVGQILVENIRSFAMLRRHKFPSDKKIQKFQKFTLKINNPIKINKQSPMQQQMNQLMKNPKIKQCIKQVLNYQMIFLLQQAEYFVVGDTPKQQWLHYALNMPVYTHFTSPIRRYPDIMVHRQLISVINAKNNGQSKDQIVMPSFKKLKEIVDRCNKNKISAKKVSSGCEKIFLCLYLKTHPVFCKAVLTDLNQYCLSICVPSYDFRSAIQFKELKKVKPLTFGKDSSQRKYVQLQCEYQNNASTKFILKQMQQIDVKLTAKQGFPIDYRITLMLPHPKDPQTSIACQ